MKPQPAMPCLFLPPWCPGQLHSHLQVNWSDGQHTASLQLAEAIAQLKHQPVALIVAVEQVASCAVSLPAGSTHWQRQALPYAVEPLLAEEVEDLHLALAERLRDGRHRVVAINRALLDGWLTYLRGEGLQVRAIHVDADLLPGHAPVISGDRHRWLLAGSDEVRLAFAPEQWPLVLSQLKGDCRVLHTAGTAPTLPDGANLRTEVIDMPLHAWLARQRGNAVDIAQGSFAVKSRTGLRHWKPVAVALAAVLMAQVAFDGVQAWLLNQQAAGYRQVNEAIYKGLFPAEKRIVNLKAQFDQHLLQGSSASRFNEMLGKVAAALPDDGELQVKRLEFQAGNARMTLQLQGGDAAARETLQQRLQAASMQVTATPLESGALQLVIRGGQ
ncbi:type II secretion system protein GspL [Stenotrophomonas humi]